MASSWSSESAFTAAVAAVVKPSASKIAAVADLAIEAARHYKHVVHIVERHIRKSSAAAQSQAQAQPQSPSQSQFAGLFMIDAITRLAKSKLGKSDPYTARFALHLPEICIAVIEAQGEEGKKVVRKLCRTWRERKAFDTELLQVIQQECGEELLGDAATDTDTVTDHLRTEANDGRAHRRGSSAARASEPSTKRAKVDRARMAHADPRRGTDADPRDSQLQAAPSPSPRTIAANTNAPPVLWMSTAVVPPSLPLPPPPAAPAPLLSAFDAYSDEEDDEDEEKRAERMRRRIEEQKQKIVTTIAATTATASNSNTSVESDQQIATNRLLG